MNWPGIYASSSSFGALVMTTNGLAHYEHDSFVLGSMQSLAYSFVLGSMERELSFFS